jgi:hypothetical protein
VTSTEGNLWHLKRANTQQVVSPSTEQVFRSDRSKFLELIIDSFQAVSVE